MKQNKWGGKVPHYGEHVGLSNTYRTHRRVQLKNCFQWIIPLMLVFNPVRTIIQTPIIFSVKKFMAKVQLGRLCLKKTHTLLPPGNAKPPPFPSPAVMYTPMAAIPLIKTFPWLINSLLFPTMCIEHCTETRRTENMVYARDNLRKTMKRIWNGLDSGNVKYQKSP